MQKHGKLMHLAAALDRTGRDSIIKHLNGGNPVIAGRFDKN